MESMILQSCTSPLVLQTMKSTLSSKTSRRFAPTICCSSRNHAGIPKLEPFSRSKFERVMKDPPLIQKSENELADYCSILEGDESYSCWRAYFKLKDLEKEAPKEDVERLILQAGGVKTLVGCLHGIAAIQNAETDQNVKAKPGNGESFQENRESTIERQRPVFEGFPKTLQELEEEEKNKMPDSPYTRLLRAKGRTPAWFSPATDY